MLHNIDSCKLQEKQFYRIGPLTSGSTSSRRCPRRIAEKLNIFKSIVKSDYDLAFRISYFDLIIFLRHDLLEVGDVPVAVINQLN